MIYESQHSPPPLSEGLCHGRIIAFRAFRAVGAFLLPVSLASLPRALEWWALALCLGSLDSQAPPPQGSVGAGITWVLLPCLAFVRFTGSASVGGGGRGQSHWHLSGWRDGVPGPTTIVAQLPEAVGTTVARRLESCSLGLQALLLCAEGWDGRHHLFCSPRFHLLYVFQSPAFRCTNVWNSLVSWCTGQRHLC